MSELELSISFPLDVDKFLRRQCPLCRRDFKVLLEENEIEDLAKKGIKSFMLEQEEEKDDLEDETSEYFCPYCGQSSPHDRWWTDEQSAYLGVYIENVMKELINKNLIGPLKRSFGRPSSGPISIRFEGKELKQEEPWISPEQNDMEIFDLPCCSRKLKIREDWKDKVFCYFCGFLHYKNQG
jgi:hypothetical protein